MTNVEILKSLYCATEDKEEKATLLSRILEENEKEHSFEREMLASYTRNMMRDINERAKKTIATDIPSMLDHLDVIAHTYGEGDNRKVILPTAYMRMLFALKENGFNTVREVIDPKVNGNTIDVTVRLIGSDGKQKGIGVAHRIIDRSSFDMKDAQDELAFQLSIGKATADAYRDAGIGIFPNLKEDEEVENVSEEDKKENPKVSSECNVDVQKSDSISEEPVKTTKRGRPRKVKEVETPAAPVAETVSTANEETPLAKDEAVETPAAAPTDSAVPTVEQEKDEEADIPIPLPVPDGYPTLEEALNYMSSPLHDVYKAVMEKRPIGPILAYDKLQKAGQTEETCEEMRVIRVIIANTPSLAPECEKWGKGGVFFRKE